MISQTGFVKVKSYNIPNSTNVDIPLSSGMLYLLVCSGSNYAQLSGVVTQGYNSIQNWHQFTNRNFTVNSGTFGKLTVSQNGGGAVTVHVYRTSI